jgi:hypothetical protein
VSKIISSIKSNPFVWLSFLLALGIALSRSISIPEPDTLWQTRFGIDTLSSGSIAHYDTYSWTMGGAPYTSNSWLWNVTLGFLYNLGEIRTIPCLAFVLILAAMSLLTLVLRKHNISWAMVFVGIAIFGLFSNVWLSARPQLIDYLSVLSILLIAKTLDLKTPKGLIAGAMLFLMLIALWQNFHLSAPLGVIIIFFVVLDRLLANTEIRLRPRSLLLPVFKSGAVSMVAAFGCFLTPFGLDGVLKGLDTSGASVGVISEWMSPLSTFNDIGWYSAVSIVLGMLALSQIWKTKRPAYFVLISLLIILTSQQNRWSPFLAVLSLAPVLRLEAIFAYQTSVSKLRPYLYTASAAVTIIFLGIGSLALVPHDVLAGTKTGYTIASHLPTGCKLFNADVTGGAIMLLRPDIKVSTDGRNDLYGREKFIYYATLGANGPEDALTWLDQQQVTCVVTMPGRSLGSVLGISSQWRIAYRDNDGFTLFLKNNF